MPAGIQTWRAFTTVASKGVRDDALRHGARPLATPSEGRGEEVP